MSRVADREHRVRVITGLALVTGLLWVALRAATRLDAVSVFLTTMALGFALVPMRRWRGDRHSLEGLAIEAARTPWWALHTSIAVLCAVRVPATVGAPSLSLELAGGISAPIFAFALVETAARLPAAVELPPGTRPSLRVGTVAIAVIEALRVSSGLVLGGERWLIPHHLGWLTVLGVLASAFVVIAIGRIRRRRSSPELEARGRWLIAGVELALALALLALAAATYGDPIAPRGDESSPVVRALVGAASAIVGGAALVMVEHPHAVDSARLLRRMTAAGLAITVTIGLGAFVVVGPTWVHRAGRTSGLLLIAVALDAVLRRVLERVLAPDQRRLLDALEGIHRQLSTARDLAECATVVLPRLRSAVHAPVDQALLITFDPAWETTVDQAGLAHRAERAASPALHEALHARPATVIVADPIHAEAVRDVPRRPLSEALHALGAIAVVPLAGGALEGALVLPRGSRREPLHFEEVRALQDLAARIGPRVAAWCQAQRAGLREQLAHAANRTLEQRLEHHARQDAARRAALPHVAYSTSMREADRLLADLALDERAVRILHEAGEDVLRWIERLHERSPLHDGLLLDLDLATHDPAEHEKLLFPSSRGPGLLRTASGGTLAIRHIHALSTQGQAALAEALASGRIGATHRLTARVVVVGLIGSAPLEEVLERRFESRTVLVPRLADRDADHESIALHALSEACRRRGRSQVGMSPSAWHVLRTAIAREGLTQIEVRLWLDRALVRCSGSRLEANDLATSEDPAPHDPV